MAKIGNKRKEMAGESPGNWQKKRGGLWGGVAACCHLAGAAGTAWTFETRGEPRLDRHRLGNGNNVQNTHTQKYINTGKIDERISGRASRASRESIKST